MIVEIDIGNTRIKWRIINEKKSCLGRGIESCAHTLIKNLDEKYGPMNVVRIASVGHDEDVKKITKTCKILWHIDAEKAATKRVFAGLEVVYQDSAKLGVDRWLAMLAAYHKAKSSVCVIDCGTAITVDFVDGHGKQVGGYIIPGLAMQQRSLEVSTQQIKLPSTALVDSSSWGVDTGEAVNNGVLRQVSGFIDGIVDELRKLARPPRFFITGGDAETLMPMIKDAELLKYYPDLVMDGLDIALPV